MISFGPVQSRRLGKSLGINNIISPKVCSYACIYCQVGETTKKSIKRDFFFRPETIYEKVSEHLQKLTSGNYPDYLTFVSNGEPTLDVNLGESVKLLKRLGIPIAVISNSSLLYQKKVRDDLFMADWVSLKVDACDNDTWQKVNRPDPLLNYTKTIENIKLFASEYKGKLCTETMLVKGLNDTIESIRKLAEIIKEINPGKAYLSIPIRPPAMKLVRPPDAGKLNMAWNIFYNNHIHTELLTGFEGTDNGYTGNVYNDILNITAVHPLREDSLIRLLINDNADFHVVTSLIKQRLIRAATYNGNRYYLREYHL